MSVYLKDDINRSLSKIMSSVQDFDSFNKNSKILFDEAEVKTTVQSMIDYLKLDTSPEKQIVEIILSHAISSEISSSGGFDVFIEEIKRHFSTFGEIKFDLNKLFPRKPTKEIVNKYIEKELEGSDDVIRNMVKKSIELSGLSGRISVEQSSTDSRSVELLTGYTFEISPSISAQTAFLDSYVIAIDGYVESVGEIHRLLQQIYVSKVPAIVFVRGMSDEVLQTLAANYKQGKLKIVPFVVPLDVNHVNTLNDIAIVSGGDVLSTTKGQLISLIDIEEFPIVDRVDIKNDSVTITCSKTTSAVNNHIKLLLEKREKSFDDQNFDYSKLYDERLKRLSPSRVVMKISNSDPTFYTCSIIDRIYRGIKSMSEHGYVSVDGKIFPIMAVHAGVTYSNKCYAMLSDIECIVTRKKKNEQHETRNFS